jgi:GAF domain-containing protein
MVELFVRSSLCVGILIFGLTGLLPFDASWKAALALGIFAGLGWRLEVRGLRNIGIAGWLAVGEGFTLALFLRGCGTLDQLGFLALVPCVYAAGFLGARMIAMAPLVASALLGADSMYSNTGTPSPAILIHAGGVLALSLVLGRRRMPQVEPVTTTEVEAPQVIEDGLLQLRENYRKLRDAYRQLEKRARRDKVAARLNAVEAGPSFFGDMCTAVRELSGAAEVALYTVAQFDQIMVVRGATDEFPKPLRECIVEVDTTAGIGGLREKVDEALAALGIDTELCNALLVDRGQVVGMISALPDHASKLKETKQVLEEAAPMLAERIVDDRRAALTHQRLTELELLYSLSSITAGAADESTLAARVAREIRPSFRLDGLSIVLIEDGSEMLVGNDGTHPKLMQAMSFAEGPGLNGWLTIGAPELVLSDVRQDARCDASESLKMRIGSYVSMPIWIGAEPAGYLAAATSIPGGISQDAVEALRLITSELSRAFERLRGFENSGLMTPAEFGRMTKTKRGSIVHLEPLKRDQMIATYGRAAFELAIRKLSRQVRAQLPPGSALCRRDQEDFLVFIDGDEEFARRWANDVAAGACFITLESTDSVKRIPLALRAKVATMTQQSHEVSEKISS